jgi:hypothetical protein
MPRALASFERATTQPSLFERTTIGFPTRRASKARSQEALCPKGGSEGRLFVRESHLYEKLIGGSLGLGSSYESVRVQSAFIYQVHIIMISDRATTKKIIALHQR